MEFIGNNRTITDCMIVAIHNAIAVTGRKQISYDGIKNRAIKMGWYVEGFGFYTQHLKTAMEYYRIRFTPIRMNLKQIRENIILGKHVFLLTTPFWGGTGHAMVATKGKKGVNIINNVVAPYGWRTLCDEYRSGDFTMLAFEIEANR